LTTSLTTADPGIKERILAHAREKFFASGFSKVTMDELSSGLGISKKTMYQHFRSKDELLDSVMEWQVAAMKGRIREIVSNSSDFVDKIYSMWSVMGKMLCQVGRQFQDDLRRFRPDLWKRISEHRAQSILANFSRLIDEGVRGGYVRGDAHKEILVLIYLGAIQSIINPEVAAQHSFSTEEAFKTVLQVYFDGILTDDARQLFHRKLSQQLQPVIQ
jgi:AcrR family transcriptional regulator